MRLSRVRCCLKSWNQGCEQMSWKEYRQCQHEQKWAERQEKWISLTSSCDLLSYHSVSFCFVSSRSSRQRCLSAWSRQWRVYNREDRTEVAACYQEETGWRQKEFQSKRTEPQVLQRNNGNLYTLVHWDGGWLRVLVLQDTATRACIYRPHVPAALFSSTYFYTQSYKRFQVPTGLYFLIHRGGGLLDVLILQTQAHVLVSTERMFLQSALQRPPFTYGLIFPHPSKWRLAKHNYSSYRFRHTSSYLLSVCSFRVPYKCLQLPTGLYFLIHRGGGLLNIIIHPTDTSSYLLSVCSFRVPYKCYWAYVPSKLLSVCSFKVPYKCLHLPTGLYFLIHRAGD